MTKPRKSIKKKSPVKKISNEKTRKSPLKKSRVSNKKTKTHIKKSCKSTRSRTYKLNVSNGVSDKQNERRLPGDVVEHHIMPFIKTWAHNVLQDILKNLERDVVYKTHHISHSVYTRIYSMIAFSSTITMGYNGKKLLDISFNENIMTLESTTPFLDHFGGKPDKRLQAAKYLAQLIITKACGQITFEKNKNKTVVTIDLGIDGLDNFMMNKILIMSILILLYQDVMENYNGTIPPLIFT